MRELMDDQLFCSNFPQHSNSENLAMWRMMVFGFLWLSIGSASAAPLKGTGFGETEVMARNAALAALAEAMQVQVVSDFQQIARVEGEQGRQDVTHVIHTRAELPILGAEITANRSMDVYYAVAELKPSRACRDYQQRLQALAGEIEQDYANAQRAVKARQAAQEKEALTRVFGQLVEYARHASVLHALASRAEANEANACAVSRQLAVRRAEVEDRLNALSRQAMTLDEAGSRLAQGIAVQSIYVYPPVPLGGQEITPFARALRDHLRRRLPAVADSEQARYLMRGEYELLRDGAEGAHVSYRVLDRNGGIVHTQIARLNPAAFAGYEARPSGVAIDALLHEGVMISHDLTVAVTTNKGRRDLLFEAGERLEILVKLSRPGWFYCLDYIGNERVYLLELEEQAQGAHRFLRYVAPEEANRWLSLGEYRVVPPFGTERLQVIGSLDEVVDRLPTVRPEHNGQLFAVVTDVAPRTLAASTAIVQQVRALAKIKPTPTATTAASDVSTPTERTGEAVLTFTTMPKASAVTVTGR